MASAAIFTCMLVVTAAAASLFAAGQEDASFEIPFVFGTNASGVVNATLAYAHAPNTSTKEGDRDLDTLLIMIEGIDAFDGGGAMGASARAPSDRAHKDDASDGELDYDPYLPNRELEYDRRRDDFDRRRDDGYDSRRDDRYGRRDGRERDYDLGPPCNRHVTAM